MIFVFVHISIQEINECWKQAISPLQVTILLLTNRLLICSLDDKHLVEKLRVRACNILSCCADRSAKQFAPFIDMVGLIHHDFDLHSVST